MGVLGSRGGQFLPRDVVQTSGMFHNATQSPGARKDDADASAAADSSAVVRQREIAESPINFYSFLEGATSQKLYTGMNGVGSITSSLLERNRVKVWLNTMVTSLVLQDSDGCGKRKWFLRTNQDVQHDAFDSVVLANQDPGFAANVIEYLQGAAPDEELSQEPVSKVISEFSCRLRGLSAARCSRYSLSLVFPRPLSELPFDAVSVHNAELQFLSRESSKPGRRSGGVECWTVLPTVSFAASLDRDGLEDASPKAAGCMWAATQLLLGRFFCGAAMPEPLCMHASRWDSAFYREPLNLNAAGERDNEAVSFSPWMLVLCGDYLGALTELFTEMLS